MIERTNVPVVMPGENLDLQNGPYLDTCEPFRNGETVIPALRKRWKAPFTKAENTVSGVSRTSAVT
jgi:hypothetical protein